ncbi:MAG: metallophosphoesterase [Deltaproteobacteria bacterium]|nr:metallophosphoesterase [Deltaproteobacteria bacterium]
MNIWAISDIHLSFTRDKPMHVFGEGWRNHWEKIEQNWRQRVAPEDVVLVPGDVSWSRKFSDGLKELEWIHRLPGRLKLLVRGNHDHWWPLTPADAARVPATLRLLAGEALSVEGEVFCGTGGWLAPGDPYYTDLDRPSYQRELEAFRRSLDAALELSGGRPFHALLHFPPTTSQGKPTAFQALLAEYPVKTLTFGHFHFPHEWQATPQGNVKGVRYALVSADYVDFAPVRIGEGLTGGNTQ